jgi:hypothetical protein
MVMPMATALLDSEGATPVRSRSGAGSAPGTSGAEPPVRCGGCATAFDSRAWLALPRIAVLTGDAIATHVVKWPAGVSIEIRRCPRCGRSLARTTAR